MLDERKALLGTIEPLQRAQQLNTQADLAKSAADTTASLQRTRQLMAEVATHHHIVNLTISSAVIHVCGADALPCSLLEERPELDHIHSQG